MSSGPGNYAPLPTRAAPMTEPISVVRQSHLDTGRRLAATSDYDTATSHLLLASLDEPAAPEALAKLSEVAWVRHDHGRGREYALEGLELDPGHPGCRVQLRRNEAAEAAAFALGDTAGTVTHLAAHPDRHGNAGDRALADAVRRGFALGGDGPRWWNLHAHQLFDEQRLAQVNAGHGLVVGGGALFDPKTAPNGNSGWQWNVSDEMLRRITVPLVVWGVGFTSSDVNRFGRSLRSLVERADFVGLRNTASVERVRALLPSELAGKVHWQPCPTTVAARLGGPGLDGSPTPDTPGPVLLNVAPGRHSSMFLKGLRDWVLVTRERAEVRYVAHTADDEILAEELHREYGLSLPVVPLYEMTVPEIQAVYRQAALVVGTRAHAAMVPFGCGTPIVSLLLSSPQQAWFLDDLGRDDWGVPVHEPQLGERLTEVTGHLLDDRDAVVADIRRLRRRLFDVTRENLGRLPGRLRVTVADPGAER